MKHLTKMLRNDEVSGYLGEKRKNNCIPILNVDQNKRVILILIAVVPKGFGVRFKPLK